MVAKVREVLGSTTSFIHSHADLGDDTIVVTKDEIVNVMKKLKTDPALDFDIFMDVTAVDYLGNYDLLPYLKELKTRFEVVYHLYSITKNHRIRVKAPVTEGDPTIDSVTSLWIGADWMEREVYDLYGITFNGHPNMKRILLYKEFEGHPLRKDYSKTKRQPLIGPIN